MKKQKMVKVWSVMENLPDTDPILFNDESSAEEYFHDLQHELDVVDGSDYVADFQGPFFVTAEDWEKYKRNGVYPELYDEE